MWNKVFVYGPVVNKNHFWDITWFSQALYNISILIFSDLIFLFLVNDRNQMLRTLKNWTMMLTT